MQKTSLYSVTVPVMQKSIGALTQIIEKAEAWANESGKSEAEILDMRLAPDMFPFVKQVQLVSDQAKGFVARIQGMEPESMEDTENTFASLRERLSKTAAILASVSAESIDSKEDMPITLKFFPGKHLLGFNYALEYVLPNFYFHVVTAYGILRSAGLPIGKMDFIVSLPLQDNPAE